MTFSRKVLYFRVSASFVVFGIVWLVLGLGSSLFDKGAITSEIDDKLGIKFLNPNIQGFVHTHGWQVIVAAAIAGFFFLKGKDLLSGFLARRLAKPEAFKVNWANAEDPSGLKPEFVIDLNGSDLVQSVLLRNDGIETLRITRIEAIGMVTKVTALHGGDGFGESVAEMEMHGSNSAEELFQWKEIRSGQWTLEGPIVLEEGAEQVLPDIGVSFDNNNEDTTERVRLLVGDPSIRVLLNFFFFVNDKKLSRKLETPLRVFPPREDLKDDDGVGLLLQRLGIADEAEKLRLRRGYEDILDMMQQIRANYVEQNAQRIEKNLLVDWRRELEPYDRWVEQRPTDPATHFERGRFLLEKGLLHEPLEAFHRASELGLRTQEILVMKARVLVDLGRHAEALETLKEIADPDLNDAKFLAVRGEALFNMDAYEPARKDLEQAIRLDPKAWLAYVFLGLAMINDDAFDPDHLVSLLRQAVDQGYTNRAVIEDFSRMVGDPAHSAILQLAGQMPSVATPA